MIKNLVDQHVDNRTYHNIKPKYKYKAWLFIQIKLYLVGEKTQ
jgi:hypothetical protein